MIVLEDLKDIRERIDREISIQKKGLEKLKGKSRRYVKDFRKLTLELQTWNFADFQTFLEYKANWLGIPVVYVSAKDTSIKCNKCGHIDKKNYTESEDPKALHKLRFRCVKCGYQCNADFNASVNIGKGFYETLVKE